MDGFLVKDVKQKSKMHLRLTGMCLKKQHQQQWCTSVTGAKLRAECAAGQKLKKIKNKKSGRSPSWESVNPHAGWMQLPLLLLLLLCAPSLIETMVLMSLTHQAQRTPSSCVCACVRAHTGQGLYISPWRAASCLCFLSVLSWNTWGFSPVIQPPLLICEKRIFCVICKCS